MYSQSEAPPVAQRMVWMFGHRTDAERAQGRPSDNVFAMRAGDEAPFLADEH